MQLNINLFERMPSGVVPTDACLKMLDHLTLAESELEAGVNAAIGVQSLPEGLVRLTSVPTLVTHFLIPAAQDLVTRYPKLELEFIGLPSELSMMQREADIAIRLAQPAADFGARTRRIGHLHYAAYALAGTDSFALPWLTYEGAMAHLPQAQWIMAQQAKTGETICQLRCNDADGLIALLRSGYGKTLLPTVIGDKLPELVTLHNLGDMPRREIWLIVHPNLVKARRVQVVIEWIDHLFTSRDQQGDGAGRQ